MAFGLTLTGFVPKPLETLVEDMEADVRADLGVIPTGALKKLINRVAITASELWELGEVVYGIMDPDSATETALEQLAALTGTVRKAATKSAVDLTLTGTPLTNVPSGSRAQTAETEVVFETIDDAVIATLTAWAAATPYVVGDRRTQNAAAWIVTVAGTSAGSGGPDPTGLDQGDTTVDGTVTWKLMGSGTGAVDVASEALETGPQIAESGDITTIATPVSGWTSVINLLDADLGRNVETDAELRVRRELELAGGGDGTVEAIRAVMLDTSTGVDGVTAVTVFHNPTDATDGDGVPPHSVEVLVQGGDDQDIWDFLLAHVAAGIGTHGTEDGTSTDDEGTDHDVSFSRPDEVEIYVVVNLTYDPRHYPIDGDDVVATAIVSYGDGQATGRDAVASRISALGVFQVAGVIDAEVFIGTAPAPGTSVTVPISLRQLATFDTSRITINSTEAVP